MQTFGKIQPPKIVPRGPLRTSHREPDSGISSARSTTTVPWSHGDSDQGVPILDFPRPDSSLEAEHQF